MQFLNKHEDQLKRGLTYDLWKNFPAGEIFVRGDASEGVGSKLDVGAAPYAAAGAGAVLAGNGVRAFTDATGTVAGLTQAQYSGGTGFRMTSSVDNEAAELQWGGGGEPFIISDSAADAKELCFECCFRVDSVTANDVAFFIGLAGAGTLDGDMIADNGADIADRDMVGLMSTHADTTGVDVIYQDTGSAFTVHKADFATIAVNTWYIFGMRYLPNTKKLDLYWGVGDRATSLVKSSDPIISTDIADGVFPDGQGLCPTIAIKGGHADDVSLDIRSLACAQVSYAAD